MATIISVTGGGDDLINRAKAQQQAGRLAKAEQNRKRNLYNEKSKQTTTEDKPPVGLEPLPYRRDIAAQRGAVDQIAFVGSGFNSPVTAASISYGSQGVKHVWNQIAAGSLRFIYGQKAFSETSESVPTASNGFVLRSIATNNILATGWSYYVAGGHPPVAEMLLLDTWGGRYVAPRHPMVSSKNSTIWLTWDYRLDVATQYIQEVQGGVWSPFSAGSYSYQNTMLFVRLNLRTNRAETKFYRYSQFAPSSGYSSRYLNNCWPDDPAKELRAQGYSGEYHVKGNKAYFLRAIYAPSEELGTLTYVYPYQLLQSTSTGKVTADSWRVDEYTVNTSSTATLKADLERGAMDDETFLPTSKTRISVNASKYSNSEQALFGQSGVSPVPDAAGRLRNTLLPIYVVN